MRKLPLPSLLLDILGLAWPLGASYLLVSVTFVVNSVVLGHPGTAGLAGGALGTLTCNLTGLVIIIGLLSAIDTMSSQVTSTNVSSLEVYP